MRRQVIVLVAILTSAAVAFAGIIGFVGLVVPHILRMAMGPGHRVLLPASALGGALLLLIADTVARTLVPNADLPIGMLTALVGGPFFFWLIRRTRKRPVVGHEPGSHPAGTPARLNWVADRS